jgi:hypothetical protein
VAEEEGSIQHLALSIQPSIFLAFPSEWGKGKSIAEIFESFASLRKTRFIAA